MLKYKKFEEEMKVKYPFISHFTFEEDEEDGKAVHICWFKFPYKSKESNAPYFHFTDDSFEKYISYGAEKITLKDVIDGYICRLNYGLWDITDEGFEELVKNIS